MTITVSSLKRAAKELAADPDNQGYFIGSTSVAAFFLDLADSPLLLALLAERLRRTMTDVVHNVKDPWRQWIGRWETEPLDWATLNQSMIGRYVIYQDYGRAELGRLTSWGTFLDQETISARFSLGATSSRCLAGSVVWAIRPSDGDVPPDPL